MIDAYVSYDGAGNITGVYYGNAPADQTGTYLLIDESALTAPILDYKVVTGVLTLKTANPTTNATGLVLDADGVDSITFASIPNPSTMAIECPERAAGTQVATITDGTIVFKTTVAGYYYLTLDSANHRQYTATIEAN